MGFNIIFKSPESRYSFRKAFKKAKRLPLNIFKDRPNNKGIFQSNLKEICHFSTTLNFPTYILKMELFYGLFVLAIIQQRTNATQNAFFRHPVEAW